MPQDTSHFDKAGFIFFLKYLVLIVLVFGGTKFGSAYLTETWTRQEIQTYEQMAAASQMQLQAIRVAKAQEELPVTFKPTSLSWTLATSSAAWAPRDSATSFVFQDKLWTMGGLNGNKEVDAEHNVLYWEAPHFNDIWNSDDGITWELVKPHAAWAPRRSMSVVFFKDKLWMFGGWNIISGYENDIWNSDDGITWKKLAGYAPWEAREGQSVEIWRNKIWLIGGVNYDTRQVKNDVWYSDNGTEWHKATSSIPWSGRWDHDTVIFKNKMFLSGGMNLNGETFADVWSTIDGITWELVTNTPPWQARQGHALIEYKDTIWSIGRLNDIKDKGENDVWFSTDGKKWNKTKNDPEWAGREDHSVLLFKDKLFVFGGMDADWKWRNDVWISN